MESSSEKIRALNDRFRRGDTSIPGHVVITLGVKALVDEHEGFGLEHVAAEVSSFDAFTPDNDPYGEHDFGAFEFLGQKLFWKIDYYAPGLDAGAEDPGDPWKSVRVLTIMLACEY